MIQKSCPLNRVIVLGAAPNLWGNIPSALVPIQQQGKVLDWQLEAFSIIEGVEVSFIGGYRLDVVMKEYPSIQFFVNPQWQQTGPAMSLSFSPINVKENCFVCYSDIVFKTKVVEDLCQESSDVVLAVDSNWLNRYDRRSMEDIQKAEKIIFKNKCFEVGRQIFWKQAHAEFIGLVKFSKKACESLNRAYSNNIFHAKDGIPEIINYLVRQGFNPTVVQVGENWAELNAPQDLARFVLGTKAETLDRLSVLVHKGKIDPLVYFSHRDWNDSPDEILKKIQNKFPNSSLIVRSSAANEDSWAQSGAGRFTSVTNVPSNSPRHISNAINNVIHSYEIDDRLNNQIFVQEMLLEIQMSGVIMTRSPQTGSPYYVLNFDSTTSRTDTVTSGTGRALRTLFFNRYEKIPRNITPNLSKVLEVTKEIEGLVGYDSLDIEFACTKDGIIHILQVRPIAMAPFHHIDDVEITQKIKEAKNFFHYYQKSKPSLLGEETVFSVMADWNPAEMIGTKPKPLALSLYRYLITDDIWALQRAEYGYRDVRPTNLLVEFLGHPYIDVRTDFNSFIPAKLPEALSEDLVNYYISKLKSNPALHDKVEFEILFTCYCFDIDEKLSNLTNNGFNKKDVLLLKEALFTLTCSGIERIEKDLTSIKILSSRFEKINFCQLNPLDRAFYLLNEIKRFGTPAFSHLARNAFAATAMLKSLVQVGCLNKDQVNQFLSSIHTISGEMQKQAKKVFEKKLPWNEFVRRFGHLRPGTYDITSPRYDHRPEEFLRPMVEPNLSSKTHSKPFDKVSEEKIIKKMREHNFSFSFSKFINFLTQSIKGREYAKFIFTKNLSEALESITAYGKKLGLSTKDLSFINLSDLFALRGKGDQQSSAILNDLSQSGKKDYSLTQSVFLPEVILTDNDFSYFEVAKAKPNFITQGKVQGPVVFLEGKYEKDLDGKIILIENADPGYDWLFSRKITGFITKFGGVNSHMAVRATEFQLPAAIGVGELIFEEIHSAKLLEIDCASQQIRIVK